MTAGFFLLRTFGVHIILRGKLTSSIELFLIHNCISSILGFQTHTTPVLLAQGERAELATEEYLPLTPIMEGFVILRKNPDY